MLMSDKTRTNQNVMTGTYTLSRNNLEFAALVVFFFGQWVIYAFMVIVMLFQS